MKISDQLQILSQIISFVIYLYFAVILIKTNPLNQKDLIISSIGLFSSLIISIISAIEKRLEYYNSKKY